MCLRLVHLILILLSLLVSVESQNWTHHAVLDGNGKFRLYWNPPEDKRGDSEISFKVELQGKGYIGLGFSPDGRMPGSDIVTGWIKDGEVYFQDRHADAYGLPRKDGQQDYDLIDGYENDNVTVLIFRRKLDTCDEDDWVIDEGTVRVIYAYSEEDPESDDPFYYGENRGSKSIILLQSAIGQDMDIDFTSLLQWDVRFPNVSIPPVDTLYWCTILKSPALSEKHHIVYIKPLIQEGHEQTVHHMSFFECIGGTPEEYDLVDDKGFDCFEPAMSVIMYRCRSLNVNWAIGGYDIPLPEHVGLPVDPGPGKYYMLQVHYDNPQLINGMVDQSGFRFYYTPELRQYDSGKFTVSGAIVPRVFIPPGQEEYVVAAHANPECFTSMLPDTGVKAIAVFLHSHTIARRIKVRHFRGNEELSPLYEDKHYDFKFQTYRYYPQEVTILPNDLITAECAYNSTERNSTTFSGSSSKEEMCGAILIYYPRVSGTVAISGPTFATINKIFNTNVTNEADVISAFGNYEWDSVDMSEVQNGLRYSEQETLCYFAPLPEVPEQSLVSYPKDFIPYEPQSTCNVNTK